MEVEVDRRASALAARSAMPTPPRLATQVSLNDDDSEYLMYQIPASEGDLPQHHPVRQREDLEGGATPTKENA